MISKSKTTVKPDSIKGIINPEDLQDMLEGRKPREVKMPFEHVIQVDWHRKFSLKERLSILFGYAVWVAIRIPCRHKPSEIGVVVCGEVTPFDKPTELLRENAALVLKEQFAGRIPIQTEPKDPK